jgi:polyisoprenoid-binding protein YceI
MSVTNLTAATIPTGVYTVDPAHSHIGFAVRHMGIATVRGSFHGFQGTVDATADAPVLEGTVEASTIDTGEENRDGHLKSPEFFDVDQNPQIAFHSTATDSSADGTLTLAGEITIKGITKSIELTGELAENGDDPWGNQRIGLELEGAIDRREFDLSFNQTLPNGNLLIANEVKLVVSVSAVKGS